MGRTRIQREGTKLVEGSDRIYGIAGDGERIYGRGTSTSVYSRYANNDLLGTKYLDRFLLSVYEDTFPVDLIKCSNVIPHSAV